MRRTASRADMASIDWCLPNSTIPCRTPSCARNASSAGGVRGSSLSSSATTLNGATYMRTFSSKNSSFQQKLGFGAGDMLLHPGLRYRASAWRRSVVPAKALGHALIPVVPAKAGTQEQAAIRFEPGTVRRSSWIPAFAGMTKEICASPSAKAGTEEQAALRFEPGSACRFPWIPACAGMTKETWRSPGAFALVDAHIPVVPAKAGTQRQAATRFEPGSVRPCDWIPACAGMTREMCRALALSRAMGHLSGKCAW
jgi:urease beta subunit